MRKQAHDIVLVGTPGPDKSRFLAAFSANPCVELALAADSLAVAFAHIRARPPAIVVVMEELTEGPRFQAFGAALRPLGVPVAVATASSGKPRAGHGVPTVTCAVAATAPLEDLLDRDDATLLQYSGPRSRGKLVVMGASTGGIEALLEVLSVFPSDGPPTMVVQHIGASFVGSFAARLGRHCRPEVDIARDGDPIRPGKIYVAGGNDSHLTLSPCGTRCKLATGDPFSGHRPSVDMLFSSASSQGARVIGVLLTGMGRDGAYGLLRIRDTGGATIGQDAATSTVYGMPRVAAEIGAVMHQLPLQAIGPAILDMAGSNPERSRSA